MKVTPSELKFYRNDTSRSFIIKNNRQYDVEVNVEAPGWFEVFPKEQIVKPGRECVFFIHLVSNNWKSTKLGILCKHQGIITTMEVKLTKHLFFGFINQMCFGSGNPPNPGNETPENSDSLECKICLLEYNDNDLAPRILGCGHTICTRCAETIWNQEDQDRVICPFDRQDTVPTGFPGTIDFLPKNFLALEMLETRKNSPQLPPPPNQSFSRSGTITKKNARLNSLIKKGNAQKLQIAEQIQRVKCSLESYQESSEAYQQRKAFIEEQFELKKQEALQKFQDFTLRHRNSHCKLQEDLEKDLQTISAVTEELQQISMSNGKLCSIGDVANLGMVLGAVENRSDEEMCGLGSFQAGLIGSFELQLQSSPEIEENLI